jgi:glycosyltransferase involved in cell wall biosynthesis
VANRICFIGGARYSSPLNATSDKKFRALTSVGELFVVGFSQDLIPRRFTEHARFYLLPKLPVPILRHAEVFVVGTPLALWLVFRYGVQVLIAQSPYEGFVAAWAKKIAGWCGRRVVLVVESHGDFEESIFLQRHIALSRLYRFFMRSIARFSLRHADFLRAISTSTRRQLERWMPEKSVAQFPTWTDIDVFLRTHTNQDRRSQNIVYVGVLIPRKGVHHLINAFACVGRDFSEACLLIVGHEENKSYADGLKKQVAQLGLDGRIRFVKAMPQADLAVYMRRACVFVLPSVSEGLGRVVVEAMATGTPVIGSNVGGILDMVKDGVTGFLVPPSDEHALAEKIRWFLGRPKEAREMGQRAQATAKQFFSTEAYVAGYQRIFEAAQTFLIEDGEHAPSAL